MKVNQPQSDEANLRWYLARTQPLRELTAEHELQKQGFSVYLPKTLKTVRHARRLTSRLSAYFPGYLFLSLDLQRDLWRKVNGTRGVAYLVMRGEIPASVQAGVVEDLIACSDVLGLHLPPPPEPGQRVRILSGPFSNHIAVVQRLDGAGRVRLLLDIMGGKIAADVSYLAMVAA